MLFSIHQLSRWLVSKEYVQQSVVSQAKRCNINGSEKIVSAKGNENFIRGNLIILWTAAIAVRTAIAVTIKTSICYLGIAKDQYSYKHRHIQYLSISFLWGTLKSLPHFCVIIFIFNLRILMQSNLNLINLQYLHFFKSFWMSFTSTIQIFT